MNTPDRFAETTSTIYHDPAQGFYATCKTGNCTWVGPWRSTVGAAKRDVVQHLKAASDALDGTRYGGPEGEK